MSEAMIDVTLAGLWILAVGVALVGLWIWASAAEVEEED